MIDTCEYILLLLFFVLFFFKQKTAYEMRISDWSSDVCSSDLKAALNSAIRRMAIVASDQTHRIRLSLGGPMLKFSVQTPDLGEIGRASCREGVCQYV